MNGSEKMRELNRPLKDSGTASEGTVQHACEERNQERRDRFRAVRKQGSKSQRLRKNS